MLACPCWCSTGLLGIGARVEAGPLLFGSKRPRRPDVLTVWALGFGPGSHGLRETLQLLFALLEVPCPSSPEAEWRSHVPRINALDGAASAAFLAAHGGGKRPIGVAPPCQVRWKLDRKNIRAGSFKWHADELAAQAFTADGSGSASWLMHAGRHFVAFLV